MKKIFLFIPLSILVVGVAYIASQKLTSPTDYRGAKSMEAPYIGQKKDTVQTTPRAIANYTLVDIAKHSIDSDCWTAIDGSVYDLTPFVSEHPGGPGILAVCGKDGSELFAGQHGQREKNRMSTYLIGILMK
jgi:cytochrome b involved in lipid metabolism